MNKKILKLENISLSYDNRKTYVLKDISFSVFSGEVLSIIGLNGTGKTSLLKIISGIKKYNSGNIVRDYNKMAYVPQKINLDEGFPVLVREFIEIYNRGIKLSQIQELLDKFDSADLINKRVDKLSGGQLQKVLIISALLSKPDLLLLDEPTAGIDIVGEEIFYEIIKEVKVMFPDISIILVSHNINLVYKNSDKVICLNDNNFCCHGTPTEVGSQPIIKEIFGEYTLPYEHHPHSHKKHESCDC